MASKTLTAGPSTSHESIASALETAAGHTARVGALLAAIALIALRLEEEIESESFALTTALEACVECATRENEAAGDCLDATQKEAAALHG